ncbi:MAG: DEAD/DEAH box helicase [Candidatus Altiarchaeota archaeon]|nr:DEAD/DEAH box helicase [Candidatus Altiarchaeota archaeon]
MTELTFVGLGLVEPLRRALKDEGYIQPTPIQVQAIPSILLGRDLMGVAQTGTGKTAAFALPIMQRLAEAKRHAAGRTARVLILAPTRELTAQIGDSFKTYGKYMNQTQAVVFGGVGQNHQVHAMHRGVDVLIATPGRLLDLINQGYIRLDGIEIFVLDEADRMLDMGFIHDIRKIISKLPSKRQSLFFSATMPREIISLSHTILTNPVKVSVTPESPTVELIDQKVMFVDRYDKGKLLSKILKDKATKKTLVFTRTKHVANKVALNLTKEHIPAQAIHGNKSQSARTQALKAFKTGRTPVLVATDIAARGIDVDNITHVINYEMPDEPDSYVHRIGRTARAGASGVAISFCEAQERDCLRDIERHIRQQIRVVVDHPYHSHEAMNATGRGARRPPRGMSKPQQHGGRQRKYPQKKTAHRRPRRQTYR